MKKRTIDAVNLTPMIDIVFQMIIFFVFTIDLDREKFDKSIEVPYARDATPIEEFEPSTIYVQVLPRRVAQEEATIKVGTAVMGPSTFRALIRDTVRRYGRRAPDIPVLIYGDRRAIHRDIKQVMDICTEEGLSRINIAGMIQQSNPVQAQE